jgi:hypothetical protein
MCQLSTTKREARCRGGLSLYLPIAVYRLSETPGVQAGSFPKPGTRLCWMTWGGKPGASRLRRNTRLWDLTLPAFRQALLPDISRNRRGCLSGS